MKPPDFPKWTPARLHPYLVKLAKLGREVWKQTSDAQLFTIAGSLAYTTLLSIIPALAVSLAIFHAFGGLEKLHEVIEPFVIRNLAEPASEEAIQKIRDAIGRIHAGALGTTGIVTLILITMSMLYSAESAINQVWRAPMRKSWFHRIATYWLFVTLGPIAGSFALGMATSRDIPVWRILPSGAGAFILSIVFFFIIYRWVPNYRVHSKVALISAAFTGTLWALTRVGYAFYLTQVVTYDRIYGSLGAIPVLMVWIYLTWLIVLGGAVLGAALQRKLAM